MEAFCNTVTRAFIDAHRHDDVRRLALAAHDREVDMPFALDQIAGRQTAVAKLPRWAAIDGIVYPPHLAMEQCSSQTAAQYKADLVLEQSLVDLTGGYGVDFSFMAARCATATYVERQAVLCDIARHNFPLLGLQHATVVYGDGVEYLQKMEAVDTIYLDPARRDEHGRRVYDIAACTPDVTQLAPLLLAKSRRVIVKLSPMVDITQAMRALPGVRQVHIVSVGGECKELLVVMEREAATTVTIHCVNNDQTFVYDPAAPGDDITLWDGTIATPLYLYEPNASVMKAGCFAQVATRYGVAKVARDSHLFVADRYVDDFPGRAFVVDAVTSLNKKDLRRHLQGITQANIAVRNFPSKPAALSKRLGLKDGGEHYIFATTLATGAHALFITHKVTTPAGLPV